MSTWTIYFILMLDSFLGFIALAICLSILIFVLYIAKLDNEYDKESKRKIMKYFIKPSVAVFIISSLMLAFVPSTKQALILMGSDYLIRSERISENVDKTLDYFEQVLDEKLSDTNGGH